jgi:hypothetical protein
LEKPYLDRIDRIEGDMFGDAGEGSGWGRNSERSILGETLIIVHIRHGCAFEITLTNSILDGKRAEENGKTQN